MLEAGISHTSCVVVSDDNTALTMGSGDLPVFATPAMVALMENAAMLAVAQHTEEGQTTVGAMMQTSHVAPSPVGATVTATATLTEVSGRKLTFKVTAAQGDTVIGEGTHIRYVVDRERFMEKIRNQE